MKPTDFAYHLTSFLSRYMPGTMGLSPNTIMSYRDTFHLLLEFCCEQKKIAAEKMTLGDLNKKLVEEYLDWIEKKRNCKASTRNVRLAAIHAFCRYLQIEFPDYIYPAQQILAIPVKKAKKATVEYMTLDAMKYLLETPDSKTKEGRRDLVLLSLLYDSGARVQELADLRVSDVRVAKPATVKLTGKGRKSRIVPLMKPMATLLEQYLIENGWTDPCARDYPLFQNRSKSKLTREGISYIVKKYADEAIQKAPELFPDKLSPHCYRHSKAVHLLQSGVNLIYIRDFLGHVDIQTTEIYARIDGEMKRKALEKSTNNVVSDKLPEWQSNAGLMNWLKGLGK
ncbi:site-specific integrase [Paenibacillus alkaliterrae]|uniref:site-specific integrase n=1 Tax=Paenibacillus alkaliterrae TaxID=320909 RepID=UPI001F29C293|nr:site-specific integrase [Paenibacillus alkaliterrae]MCF2941833.1 site-specific integrase [Paenibacillus alkaliterrae]